MNPTRRDFLYTTVGILGSVVAAPPFRGWGQTVANTGSGVIADTQWGFSRQEEKRLARLTHYGLLEVAMVATLPDTAEVNHLGWPVATRLTDGRTLVLFRRASGHTDSDDAPQAGHYILYSDDANTWQAKPPIRLGPLPGMHCIGSANNADGTQRLIAITSGKPRTMYTSEDRGKTWQTHTDAFTGMLRGAAHVGPNLIMHPKFGLVAAFGQETGGGRRNFLISSTDTGHSWRERIWLRDVPGRGFEPALATWGPGHMVMISREVSDDFAIGSDGYFGHTQHVYEHKPGSPLSHVYFRTTRSNIVGNPAVGRSCNDTADVIYNPVSKRIEVLQSHRWGGGQGRTGSTIPSNPNHEISSLNLWSMDPDDLLAGGAEWRFDGTIIERIGFSRKGNRDGLHPGGSIVDEVAGMQHIFVYAGWRKTPSSIFRISRTLDTEYWRKAVL